MQKMGERVDEMQQRDAGLSQTGAANMYSAYIDTHTLGELQVSPTVISNYFLPCHMPFPRISVFLR